MSKKLNPGLFEDFHGEKVQSSQPAPLQPQTQSVAPSFHQTVVAAPQAGGGLAMAPHAMNHPAPQPIGVQSPVMRMEYQRLSEEMNGLRSKMRNYETQVDVFRNQMSDFVKTIDQRFERLSQALSRMEKSIHAQGREGDEKLRVVREKIQSQGFEEAKIEGLIERQTVVIRNFENRLTAMQKIINEKELLLMKYFEALRQSQAQQSPKK